MKPWLKDQLDKGLDSDRPVGVVIDPDGLLAVADMNAYGQVIEARDWFAVRKAYEQDGRRRAAGSPNLVILIHSRAYRDSRDLPFDIEEHSAVVGVRIPVPSEYHKLVLDLPDDLSGRAVRLCQSQPRELFNALIADLWGVALPGRADPARELDVIIRLRSDPTVPSSLWPALRSRLQTPLAQALANEPPDAIPLQQAWQDYLQSGAESPWADTLGQVGLRLATLFHSGLLRPARRTANGLPDWTALGSAEANPEERLIELLEARPDPWPPATVGDWARMAEWWAEARSTLADSGAAGRGEAGRAWATWQEIDRDFRVWLQREYGSLMLRSAAMPLTVDKILGFLARRLRQGEAKRILLVVLDGMGLAQWALLRRTIRIKTVTSAVSFAMIPTLTPVSRQAIIAGRLPRDFAETLRTTDSEETRWITFWRHEGLDAGAVQYTLMTGATKTDASLQPGLSAVAIVVQAVDKMLHGADVLGDIQAAAALRAWAEQDFLRTLVDTAVNQGYEVWLTSDHGNMEAVPLGTLHEGLAVEAAGLRVRWYTDPALRDGARAEGIAWDPPGLPAGSCYPLFAPGRGGYFSDNVRVTHGGISLDEVIVPFVRVET